MAYESGANADVVEPRDQLTSVSFDHSDVWPMRDVVWGDELSFIGEPGNAERENAVIQLEWEDQEHWCTGRARHVYRAVIYCSESATALNQAPSNAVEFVDWITKLVNNIPSEFRVDATVSHTQRDECDECGRGAAYFSVQVDRKETDEEYDARRAVEISEKATKSAARKAAAEKASRATYERLKKKYEK